MPTQKISEMTEANLPLDGTEDIEIVQSAVTRRCSTQDIADLAGSGGVKTYKALLSYNGSSFTEVELSNSVGAIVWTAPTANTFRSTLAAAFPVDKTFIQPVVFEFAGVMYVVSSFRASDNILTWKPFLLSDGTQPVSLPSFSSIPILITVNP